MIDKNGLTPEQITVCINKGTEPAFSGKYNDFWMKGQYYCVCCGNLLFKSDHKFESKSGWPSFSNIASSQAVKELDDTSHGMRRTEVICQKCEAHLGHVFTDGPLPTKRRYCINSVALQFLPTQ